jgi:phage repressor protein C with HTH and peptisase S24 domain
MVHSGLLATYEGRYAILQADLPGESSAPIGVLLQDPETDKLHLRLRRDWDDIAEEDAEVFELLESDLATKAEESGAAKLFEWLEDTLSGNLRITERRNVLVSNFERTLNRLYAENIQSTLRPGVTHIPKFTLRAAAGRFRDNAEIEPETYIEAPPDLRRVTDDLFVGEIAGTSMEPDIPDGSVCLFRHFGAGTRQGRLVLVEELGRGSNERYTVKRYVSSKRQRPDSSWDHAAIRLEPLNPEHEAWELNPEEDRYRIVAEFVRVLY